MSEATESEPVPAPRKTYIGDSVYVEFDGYYIEMTTNNGYPDDPRNKIGLEPQVIEKLKQFIQQVEAYREDYLRRNPS